MITQQDTEEQIRFLLKGMSATLIEGVVELFNDQCDRSWEAGIDQGQEYGYWQGHDSGSSAGGESLGA